MDSNLRKRNDYDDWERSYFTHLDELREIFARNFPVRNSMKDVLKSDEFLVYFSNFIYQVSSKKIVSNLEPVNEDRYNSFYDLRVRFLQTNGKKE